MKTFTQEEVDKILKDHELWLNTAGEKGKRADFRGGTLSHKLVHDYETLDYNQSVNIQDFLIALQKGVNLTNTNLSRARLGSAYLDSVSLHKANLEHSSLVFTNLRRADLSESNLRYSMLTFANLEGAKLNGANLVGAYLLGTLFVRTELNGADFRVAYLRDTTFIDVDLSNVINLDKCDFTGPCAIDFRTLLKSKNLPVSFLRGCGFPDSFIEYLPSLIGNAIEFYSCFISHSSKDKEFANRLYADLQNEGVRCWFAPEDLQIGAKIRPTLDEKIRLHDKLLIILSENSIESDWVEKEVEAAFEKEINNKETVLFPIRLDAAVMNVKTGWAADIKRCRHIADFTEWKNHDGYRKAFKRLLRNLKE